MRITVLVTGASGTVGIEVLKQLILQQKKYRITVFDVDTPLTRKRLKPYWNKVEVVYGDISNKQDVLSVAKGKDIVIHLAAIIPPLADENTVLAHNVNVEGTKNLVSALESLSPKCFLLYSSSISVYGDRLKNPYIKVGDILQPSECDEYAHTKIAAEEIIQSSQLDWTIFRLSAIMGRHKVSKLMFHMPLKTPLEITTPSDAARAFVNGIQQRKILQNNIYNLGGGNQCRTTFEDFLTQSFQIFGLGSLDFPQKTFAEKNFHCGFYSDGDILEEIVHFRKDTLNSYFVQTKKSINPIKKIAVSLFRSIIKRQLTKKSEPLKAFMQKNAALQKRFFN